jgi:hypothetical protein
MTSRQLTLALVDGNFAVCRLEADAPIPSWATVGEFFSITRTADELSVVCRADTAPEGIRSEPGWRCLRVAGTLPFAIVGVLASITVALADNAIPVFAVSTFDTDYVLVKEQHLAVAVAALRERGHIVQ